MVRHPGSRSLGKSLASPFKTPIRSSLPRAFLGPGHFEMVRSREFESLMELSLVGFRDRAFGHSAKTALNLPILLHSKTPSMQYSITFLY